MTIAGPMRPCWPTETGTEAEEKPQGAN